MPGRRHVLRFSAADPALAQLHGVHTTGGKMFPGLGRIHVAPFSDEALFQELNAKAAFWLQPDFYGVDISVLHSAAVKDYFSQARGQTLGLGS